MVAGRLSHLMKRVMAIATLVVAVPAAASAQAAGSEPRTVSIEQKAEAKESHLDLGLGQAVPTPRGPIRLGTVTIDGLFQPDTSRIGGGFGAAWQATAAASYTVGGGIEVSAALLGRRGYEAPLFMTTAAGSDVAIATAAQNIVATSRVPVIWDTRLRVRRRVFTRGGLNVDLVAEAINLVNANIAREEISSTLTSRTFRFGVLFGF